MRSSIVPAQVTTVEDRIMGNLGLSQLLLLTVPVFGSGMLYSFAPPFFKSSAYKVVFGVALFVMCSTLAIRLRGKIVLLWVVVLLQYCKRPRYYVFDKNSVFGREVLPADSDTIDTSETVGVSASPRTVVTLTTPERMALDNLMANTTARMSFELKKGGLYVRVTEVKQEG